MPHPLTETPHPLTEMSHLLTETPHPLTETPHPLTETPHPPYATLPHCLVCSAELPQQAGCGLQQVNTAQEKTVTVEGLLGCGRRPEYHTMTQHLYLANTTTETSLVTYILTYVHIFSRYGHIHMHTDRSHDSHMTSSSQGSFHRLCSPA